jgi:hypothetical protein
MSLVISFLFTIFLSMTVYAQSAPEYVELLCASKEKIASIYPSDPIEDVMAYKMREQKFWNVRKEEAYLTANLLNSGGPEAVQNEDHIDTTRAVLKACNAYFMIEPQVKDYLLLNKCVDDKGLVYDIEQMGLACRLLIPNR